MGNKKRKLNKGVTGITLSPSIFRCLQRLPAYFVNAKSPFSGLSRLFFIGRTKDNSSCKVSTDSKISVFLQIIGFFRTRYRQNQHLRCQNGKCAKVSCCESAGQSSLVKGYGSIL